MRTSSVFGEPGAPVDPNRNGIRGLAAERYSDGRAAAWRRSLLDGENNRAMRLIDDKGCQYRQEHKPSPLAGPGS
jgi:hypothetical protein